MSHMTQAEEPAAKIAVQRLIILTRFVFISGVSGGTIPAAYYGLRGRSALVDFRERFLVKNAEEDLDTDIDLISLAPRF